MQRRFALLSTLAAAGVIVTVSLGAEAQQLRFSRTAPGGIAATGNTLGLSKLQDANGPGTEDSIGTFISLDPSSVDDSPMSIPPWPAGTTSDWMQNGSTGDLDLMATAEVLYAELVWGGSYRYGAEDVTSFLDSEVTLAFGAQTVQVAPDAATALTIAELSYTGFEANYYLRSADVTAFVAQHGAGTYSVSGVPATQNELIDSLNAAGWSLVVAYRDDEAPIRNLSVFVGGSFVDEDSQQDYTVEGFCAPQSGPVGGSVVVGAIEGDADLTGDSLMIGESAGGTFANLAGPNNPEANFFCSQLNDHDGNLDTRGSFGDANHDAFAGTHVAGGRQGWDLTTIPLSSADGHLTNAQTSAVIRTETTGDSYVPALVALELDVTSPNFTSSPGLQSDVSSVELGDSITITAVLENDGQAPAENLQLIMPLDANLTLTGYTTNGADGDIGGQAVTKADLGTGVDAGTLAPNEQVEVKVMLEVAGPPQSGDAFIFTATWQHSFQVCANDPPITNTYSADGVSVAWDAPPPDAGTGGGGGTGGAGGEAGAAGAAATGGSAGAAATGGSGGGLGGTAGAAATGGGSFADDEAGDDGGCACSTPSQNKGPIAAAWLFGLVGLIAARLRRRS